MQRDFNEFYQTEIYGTARELFSNHRHNITELRMELVGRGAVGEEFRPMLDSLGEIQEKDDPNDPQYNSTDIDDYVGLYEMIKEVLKKIHGVS